MGKDGNNDNNIAVKEGDKDDQGFEVIKAGKWEIKQTSFKNLAEANKGKPSVEEELFE